MYFSLFPDYVNDLVCFFLVKGLLESDCVLPGLRLRFHLENLGVDLLTSFLSSVINSISCCFNSWGIDVSPPPRCAVVSCDSSRLGG